MGELKGFLIASWAALVSFFLPIGDFMLAMTILFIVNFSFGLVADIVNGGNWESKKAWQFIIQSTVFFVLMLSVLSVGEKLHDHAEAISSVCTVTTCFFTVNITRNWMNITPKESVFYKIASFIHYVLSMQFVERIPLMKRFMAEKKQEKIDETKEA